MRFGEFLRPIKGLICVQLHSMLLLERKHNMKLSFQFCLLIIAIVCSWCSANQEVNNEQCTSTSNPLFNQTIPWRIATDSGANLYIPTNQSLLLTDTTGCVTFQLYLASYQGVFAVASRNYAWALLSGTLTDHCHGEASYSVYGRQYVQYPLISIDSLAVQHATLAPVFILGTYTNGTFESDFTFTTERAEFYSNRKPFETGQQDDFRTFTNSSCTMRVRSDRAGNFLYSQPFRSVLSWNSGPQLEFVFPANIPVTAYYFLATTYYSQCPCDIYLLNANGAASTRVVSPTEGMLPPAPV